MSAPPRILPERYDPAPVESKWQAVWEARGGLPRRARLARRRRRGAARPPEGVRAGDAPVSLRRDPHGPRQELHDGRRGRAPPPADGHGRVPPDGLRLVRAPRRERRHPHRRPAGRGDRREHRAHPRAAEDARLRDRLGHRARHQRPRVLPVDAVALPADVRAGPRRAPRGRRQLVPPRPDRPRQRAGHRRALRALRPRGRAAPAHPVVPAHHRLRPAPAGRHGRAGRLARARAHHAAQLDRPVGGRPGDVRGRGRRRGDPRVHDASRHAVRRHVLHPRARAPRGRATSSRAGPRRPPSASTPRPRRAPPPPTAATPTAPRPASSPAATWSTRSPATPSRSGWPTTS